jgi:membrane protein YqaA with SNARE-associated domain
MPTWERLRRGDLTTKDASLLVLMILAAGALLWLLGWGILLFAWPGAVASWNALWAVAAVSFLGAFAIPLPGATSALLVALRTSPILAAAGVLGAAVGGTLGAAVLVLAARALRPRLEKKAEKTRWSRAMLRGAERLVHRWTYVGVAVLLSLPVVPRAVVLYAASVLKLKPRPFLVAVFVGTLVRNALVALGVRALLGGR